MRQSAVNVVSAGVGASVLMAASYAALALCCGLGPAEALYSFAAAGTLALFVVAA